MSKYNSKKIVIDGITFDSKDEGKYYEHLKSLKAKGKILNFERQPKFIVNDAYTYFGKRKRAITYTPDFTVYHLDGSMEYTDVKTLGTATQQGELRRKLFESRYNDKKLTWVCRNLKYGDEYGWIEYEALKKIRRENKKK